MTSKLHLPPLSRAQRAAAKKSRPESAESGEALLGNISSCSNNSPPNNNTPSVGSSVVGSVRESMSHAKASITGTAQKVPHARHLPGSTLAQQKASPATQGSLTRLWKSEKSSAPSAIKQGMPAQLYNRMLEQNVDKLLSKTGVMVLNSIKDPYMPQSLLDFIDRGHLEVRDDIELEVKTMLVDAFKVADKETKLYKELRLKHWKTEAPAFWPANRALPNPYNWLRAKVLYSLFPADGTMWKTLRDPFAVGVFLCKSTPKYAINVWTFVFLFFLIDKRDEYQLVSFILKFKSFQFLSGGLIAMTFASVKMFSCASDMKSADYFSSENDPSTPLWKIDACATHAPGSHDSFWIEIAMEPVRIILIWVAFLLLRSGYAKGGKEELLALEQVRIDAADGSLDGARDVKKLRRKSNVTHQASNDIDDDEFLAATERARLEMGAQTKTGGYLPVFLLWDVFAAFFSVASMSLFIHTSGYTSEMWMFWTSIYYMKAIYALLSFPFLIFGLPGWKTILTHAKMTGYDMSGHLCPKLTNAQVRRKFVLENKPLPTSNKKAKFMKFGIKSSASGDSALDEAVDDKTSEQAAAKIQARFRGRQQRGSMLQFSPRFLSERSSASAKPSRKTIG